MSAITDLLLDTVASVINANADNIETELRSTPDGKLTLSIPAKFQLVNNKCYLSASLAYARRFKDEVEASIELDDPKQVKMDLKKE
jgi:hypothetical protein